MCIPGDKVQGAAEGAGRAGWQDIYPQLVRERTRKERGREKERERGGGETATDAPDTAQTHNHIEEQPGGGRTGKVGAVTSGDREIDRERGREREDSARV